MLPLHRMAGPVDALPSNINSSVWHGKYPLGLEYREMMASSWGGGLSVFVACDQGRQYLRRSVDFPTLSATDIIE